MDSRTRKIGGLVVAAVGLVIAIVGGLADQIGIGANDTAEMGGKQIAALIVGIVLLAAGLVVALVLKDGDETSSSAEAS